MVRTALWFRYKITIKGTEHLNPKELNKPGGVLFLPNHASILIDPVTIGMAIWPYYSIRPMIVEYMYYTPGIHWLMRFLNSLPVPNFTTTSNSLKRKKSEKVMRQVIEDLRNGDNFLIYPAGKVKLSDKETIGGASGVHQIIQAVPEANIVLVRLKGLWGSSFSAYNTGRAPDISTPLIQGIKFCLKNLLFFTPRRELIVEFVPAPKDFPYNASRVVFNRYLEDWYNQPDGLAPQTAPYPGDSLCLVSYSMWGEKYLEKKAFDKSENSVDLSKINEITKEKIIEKISEMTEKPAKTLTFDLDVAQDLGLDSLDAAELSAFLHDEFGVKGVPANEITTLKSLAGFASGQLVSETVIEEDADISLWNKPVAHEKLTLAPGKTVAEVFFNNSAKKGHNVACGDLRSGVCTYAQLRLRVLLLAEYFKCLPGKYVGVLLPASVAANITILALQTAGKIPLMVNWTAGSRHLESVAATSKVEVVLSSWAFLDKLHNVDLDGLENSLLMLEDVRRELTPFDKAKAFMRSKFSTKKILKTFGIDKIDPNDNAVLLFTSGTESMPKGVPLSHVNILSNLKSIFKVIDVYSDDVLYGILPPFHSFGFSISSLFALLAGIRLASFPDPTDSLRLAQGVEKWKATILCGAPTFLKGMLKAATKEQLKTVRLCVSGAEKAPPELFQMLADIGKKGALIEGYGITECSPVLTVNPIGKPHRGVGLPLPDVELLIVHPETYEKLPNGSQGLILTSGPNIFNGYLNPDVKSPFIEIDGKKWYKTGDLGFIDEEGYLTLSGRQKRFIKVGGEMISLTALEDGLLTEMLKSGDYELGEGPAIAVTAKETPEGKTKIFLFTRFPFNVEIANRMLKDAGFSNLARISQHIELNEIPIMGSGKVHYRALEEAYLNNKPA